MADQEQLIHKLKDMQLEYSDTWIEYWQRYSDFNTWQFWVIGALLLVPLIAIYFFIDRKRALLIGFYGLNVHVWFTYTDTLGGNRNLWFYPYKVFPFLPTNFALDVSFIPVSFMLVYQWTVKRKKNYYGYGLLLCAFLAFIFKPILSMIGIFELDRGATYIHLFAGYISVMLVSKWLTNLFVYFERKAA
ncbi:CBO0543 family protein [Peribacillus deserti]|uniref:Uncharacterized protein n=1 Tax=Peribacillus deserti TaxID=673318 RepID=A0A2N5M8I0_9BACI|nr:CBO0543 family protein [Peribacillus deserti]PLT30647.1 hypothetical protein CUU66_06760 [Peribacillus deserti]